MRFLFAMLYWDNQDIDRRKNALIAWKRLQEFADYCVSHDLDVSSLFFDFSEQAVLPEQSVHISYPAGEFRKTEKVNRLLHHASEYQPDFIGIFDADMVIRRADYEFLWNWMRLFSKEAFYVCEVDDMQDNLALDYQTGQIDESNLQYNARAKGMIGDLGGLYFLPYEEVMKIQPFDERFEVWGGEDNAASLVLQNNDLQARNLFVRPLHLYHRSLESQSLETPQYQRQLEILTELQKQLVPDGLNFVAAIDELKNVLSDKASATDKSSFINFHLDERFQDIDKQQRQMILTWIHEKLMPDKWLVDTAGTDGDLRLPLLMNLICGSQLHQRVCRALTQQLQPGQSFDARQLYQVMAARYGGQPLAGQQAYAFLLWLQMLGLLRVNDESGHQFKWSAKLDVIGGDAEKVLEIIWQIEGQPPAIPVDYLLSAPLWRFLDLEAALQALGTSQSDTPGLQQRLHGDLVVFRWDEMPGFHDG